MAVSWKSHGLFALDLNGVTWSIEVERAILERRIGHPLQDAQLDVVAGRMAAELHAAALAKIEAASGPYRWVQLELDDLGPDF